MRNNRREQALARQLVRLGSSLATDPDLETLLDRLLETAREVTGARYAAVAVWDSERRELESFVTSGLSDEQKRVIGARPSGHGVLGLLTEEPRPLRIGDLSAHPSSFGFPAGHPLMSSFLGVPIVIRGHAWGNLYLTEKPGGDFDDADERAIATLASWAAIEIEHARLLAAASAQAEARERAVRGLEATQAIVAAVGTETDLPRVLNMIATRGRAIVDASSVLILLQDRDALVVAAGAGSSQAQAAIRIPIADSTSGQVMVTQRAARVGNVDTQLRVSPQSLGVPAAHSTLIVPLVYRGRSLGVLAAFDSDQQPLTFTDEDEQTLLAFAASAAIAVATAQNVHADRVRHTLDAAEAERKYWARELHDETLQALGGLKVIASAARRERDPTLMLTALDQLVDGLEAEIESVHAMISELRPAALDDLGLRPAIETLAQRQRAVHGTDVSCYLELPNLTGHDQRLAPELETTVYRLVQEALTNVAKHANAKRIRVKVVACDGQVRLEVTDDGNGFEIATVDAGFGLTSMRERVALAGGTIDIASGRCGTTVRATLPAHYGGPTT